MTERAIAAEAERLATLERETRESSKALAILDRNSSDHAKSLSALTMEIGKVGDRTAALEAAKLARRIMEARQEEGDLALTREVGEVKKELTAIKSNGNRLVWIVITIAAGVLLKWAFSGALNI